MGRIRRWREEEAEAFFAEARKLLLAGGVMAVPTETFYGLAVHPLLDAALARLFALKERAPDKPVLVLVANREMLPQVVREVPETAARLMARFWPGPLTIIFPARPQLPALLTGGTGTVGVRQPGLGLTCRLIAALGFPITGTSANRSGRPPVTTPAEVTQAFHDGVDLILDAGPCPGGLFSTIVDVTGAPRLVRAGAISIDAVARVIPEIER